MSLETWFRRKNRKDVKSEQSSGQTTYRHDLNINPDQEPVSLGSINVGNVPEESIQSHELDHEYDKRLNKPQFLSERYLKYVWNKIDKQDFQNPPLHVWVWYETSESDPEYPHITHKKYVGMKLNGSNRECPTNSRFFIDFLDKLKENHQSSFLIGVGNIDHPDCQPIQ